jgi:hypothetical protein
MNPDEQRCYIRAEQKFIQIKNCIDDSRWPAGSGENDRKGEWGFLPQDDYLKILLLVAGERIEYEHRQVTAHKRPKPAATPAASHAAHTWTSSAPGQYELKRFFTQNFVRKGMAARAAAARPVQAAAVPHDHLKWWLQDSAQNRSVESGEYVVEFAEEIRALCDSTGAALLLAMFATREMLHGRYGEVSHRRAAIERGIQLIDTAGSIVLKQVWEKIKSGEPRYRTVTLISLWVSAGLLVVVSAVTILFALLFKNISL